MNTLQIVIPLYNEIHTLPELWERLSAACEPLGMDWSVLFVDDGSSDGTTDALDQLAGSHPNISVLHLSRNFGHQAALTAGIDRYTEELNKVMGELYQSMSGAQAGPQPGPQPGPQGPEAPDEQ